MKSSHDLVTVRATHTLLVSGLFLQKFGIPLGLSYLPLTLPVYVLTVLAMLTTGRIYLNIKKLCIFLCVFILSIASCIITQTSFNNIYYFSPTSLILFLVLYASLTASPRSNLNSQGVLEIFCLYMRIFSVIGVLQYIGQHVGLRFASVSDIFPWLRPILLEDYFNSNAVVEYGSDELRSNAIFFREPSHFSQALVIGAAVEVLVLKKWKAIPLYTTAYIVSLSGTGLISLLAAVIVSSMFSIRTMMYLPLFIIGMFAGIEVLGFLAPGMASYMIGRIGEFGIEGTSGYIRYVAQGFAWNRMLSDGSIFFGMGPGSFEANFRQYMISSNAALKLTADYGIFTATAVITLFISSMVRSRPVFIPVLMLATYQLGGGTELDVNFFALFTVVCIWGGTGVAVKAGPGLPDAPGRATVLERTRF